jgi:hypothetical protein
MTRLALAVMIALAPILTARAQEAKAAPSVTGRWTMALNMSMGISRPALTLKQEGEKLTGTYAGRYGTFPLQGTIKGRAIEFSLTMTVESEKVEMSFVGEVSEDAQSMRGDADLGQAGDGTWTAKREKDSTSQKPKAKRPRAKTQSK